MNDREEAFEVAKLAAMVGGQMRKVDQMTVERSSMPANRINIHDYINKVQNPNASIPVHLPQTPQGFAPPPSEAMIQSMVPDARPSFIPSVDPSLASVATQSTQLPQAVSTILPTVVNPEIQTLRTETRTSSMIDGFKEDKNVNILTRSDVDSIRNSLKNIDKALNSMLTLFKNSKFLGNE
jgi:hypothetical protein